MNFRDVIRIAPVHPACFRDREQWAEYLLGCQEDKREAMRPFERGVYRPAFRFCRDCTAEHEREMRAARRCFPEHLKPKKEPVTP